MFLTKGDAMAFAEKLSTVDRRVAYGAALIIGLGALAADCDTSNVDPNDTTTWRVTGADQLETQQNDHSAVRETYDREMAANTFDLQMLNVAEAPRP
jgi:hypothetical protein